MITEEIFQKILACQEAGDPLKDIADEFDLLNYIVRLRGNQQALIETCESLILRMESETSRFPARENEKRSGFISRARDVIAKVLHG